MSRTLAIGCNLRTSAYVADLQALRGLAQAVEDLGFDSIWLSDHIVVPEHIASFYPYDPDGVFQTRPDQPYLELLSSLAYLAGTTRHVRLGTHVLILPYRHPLLTAKMVSTVDNLSGGRVDLGIGVGWMREEFEALGQPTYVRRGAATDEQLRILKTVWSEEVAGFEGEFYSFERVGALPHPLQKPHPPIWVGGHSPAALRRTARYGDGWLPIGARPPADLPPETIAASWAAVRAAAEQLGRDPARLRLCFSTTVAFETVGDTRRPFRGSAEQIAADFRRYREVGVDSFIVNFGTPDPSEHERQLRRFAEEVRPALG